MDLDAYSAAHRNEWDRLDALASKRSLSGPEADELIDRYQAGATQLSAIKTTAGSTRQGDRLSVTLSKARLRFTSASTNVLSQLPRFFVLQLPAALYRLRWLTLAVALATFAAASFAGQVWTNNAWIAAQCIAFGITGVWVPYVILQNAQNLGLNAAVLFSFGHGDTFFLYIAPHGMLELTAIFVAAAGGLRIFWAWVAPGRRTRGQALAEDARALFTVAIGLVFVLLIAGILEGFVTPQPWPWPVKIGLGAVALGAFLFYMLVVGRRAYRAGETGDLAAFEAGARRIYAN